MKYLNTVATVMLATVAVGMSWYAFQEFERRQDEREARLQQLAEAAQHPPRPGGEALRMPAEIHRLAPRGTFFVVEYVSVRTPTGVAGFEPGREVHFVKADEEKQLLTVSDGKYQVEVGPMQLTNDLDIAALARRQDEASQHDCKWPKTQRSKKMPRRV